MSRETETRRDDAELKGTFVMWRLFAFPFGRVCLKRHEERPAGQEGAAEGGM